MEQVTYWEDVMKYRDVQEACKYHEQLGREDGLQEGRQEGLAEGFEAGIEQGMEKGRSDREIEICLSMIARGYSNEEIAAIANLPVDEVIAMRGGWRDDN